MTPKWGGRLSCHSPRQTGSDTKGLIRWEPYVLLAVGNMKAKRPFVSASGPRIVEDECGAWRWINASGRSVSPSTWTSCLNHMTLISPGCLIMQPGPMQMRQVGSLWKQNVRMTAWHVADSGQSSDIRAGGKGCGLQKSRRLSVICFYFTEARSDNLPRTIRRVNRPPTTCSAGPLGAASGSHDLRLALNRDS